MRGSTPIKDHPIRHGINPGITYSQKFSEFEACIEAGLDIWIWRQGFYPSWFKAEVIMWYEGHNLIEIHAKDAAASSMKKR